MIRLDENVHQQLATALVCIVFSVPFYYAGLATGVK